MVCDLLCSIFAPLAERHLLPLEYTCQLAKQLKAWGLGIGRRIARAVRVILVWRNIGNGHLSLLPPVSGNIGVA